METDEKIFVGGFVSAFLFVAVLLLLPLVGGCNYTYSEGTRAGVVTKFSLKGLAVKTYEGEMNLGGMRQGEKGPIANTWEFSVTDKALVPEIERAMSTGRPITLHYRQVLIHSVWQSSTDYLITKVEPSSDSVER